MALESVLPELAHIPTCSPHAYKNQPSVMKRGRQQQNRHFPPLSQFLTWIAGLIAH